MRRILILGSAGAGKSTLATQLSAILGLPLIHLDAFFWRPGWRESPRDEWKQRVAALLSQDACVMDGNYLGTLPERLAAADTAMLLDIPRIRCMYRVIRRGLRDRGKQRADLPDGCFEQFPDWVFIRWIWAFPSDDLPPIPAQLKTSAGTRNIAILRSTAEIRRFLSAAASRVAAPPADANADMGPTGHPTEALLLPGCATASGVALRTATPEHHGRMLRHSSQQNAHSLGGSTEAHENDCHRNKAR